MKFTRETFEKAIYFLLPEIRKAKDNGISFAYPELIRMVSNKHFLSNWDDRRDYKEQLEYHIVKDAAIDLANKGYFTFGYIDYNDFDFEEGKNADVG